MYVFIFHLLRVWHVPTFAVIMYVCGVICDALPLSNIQITSTHKSYAIYPSYQSSEALKFSTVYFTHTHESMLMKSTTACFTSQNQHFKMMWIESMNALLIWNSNGNSISFESTWETLTENGVRATFSEWIPSLCVCQNEMFDKIHSKYHKNPLRQQFCGLFRHSLKHVRKYACMYLGTFEITTYF